MQDRLRVLIRRHPLLHATARRVRRATRPAPRPLRFELDLPLPPGGEETGPATITVTLSGNPSGHR